MEKLTIDYHFNLIDFKKMEEIEHAYFPDDHITSAEEVMKQYQKNNMICIGVRNEKQEVIASINVLPLKQEVFQAIHQNQMNEADVTANQIEEYEDNHSYYLYLSSISIDVKYRNQYRVIMTLLKGCIELLEMLEKRKIKIEKVMADASTIHGRKICEKLLKMEFITDTSHESKIYCKEGKEWIETVQQLKKKMIGKSFT